MDKVRKELEQTIDLNRKILSSYFFLLLGPIGTGKTYAKRYFTEESKIGLVFIPIGIRPPKNTFNFVYTQIKDNFKIIIKSLPRIPPFNAFEHGQGSTERDIENEIKKYSDCERVVKVLSKWVFGLRTNNTDSITSAERWLNFDATKKEPETKLDENDTQEIISVLFNYLSRSVFPNHRLVLWIDDWENIMDTSGIENIKINDLVRYLIDNLVYRFTLIINLSYRAGEDYGDVGKYFTAQVLDRINKTVRLDPITEEDATIYVKQRLEIFSEEEKENKLYPFSEETIRHILKLFDKPYTPRRLNIVFGNIMNLAFDNNQEIDKNFIDSHNADIKSFVSY